MFVYAAKALCGKAQGVLLGQGLYHTTVNIHNPNSFPVTIGKKVVRATREGEPLSPPTPIVLFNLGPDFAMEIDCPDIRTIAKVPDNEFIKGFVVIESPAELDVVSVHTYNGQAGSSIQVSYVPARIVAV